MPSGPKKINIKNRIEYGIFLFMLGSSRLLPLKVAYHLADFMGTLLFTVDYRHRNRAIQHVLHSGIVGNDKAKAKEMAYKSFQNMCRYFTELLKMPQLADEERIRRKVKISWCQELKDTVKDQPYIIITAHCGNWELAGFAYAIHTGRTLLSAMRDLDNPLLSKYIAENRVGWGHRVFSRNEGIKPMLLELKKNQSIAIVADQHAGTNEGVEVEFFGKPARAHASPASLHLKTGIPIMVTILKRLDNDFNFEFLGFEPIRYTPTGDKKADIQKVTQLYTDQIEKLVRLAPEQWLWPHRRWLDINRKTPYVKKDSKANGTENENT